MPPGVDVALVQDEDREEHHAAAASHADQVADLHLPRRAAEDVPDLEVLQHLARHGGGDAHDAGHRQHRRDAGLALLPRATISSAATSSVESVRPLIGLLLEPMMPTRYPETAAKKNPAMIITTVAIGAPPTTFWAK